MEKFNRKEKDSSGFRNNNRSLSSIRETEIKCKVNKYAEGSALIQTGNTHILCTASIDETVPEWLKGKGMGWVTAEYSMLPRSTHTRMKRERNKVSGRTQEIQRLIGRALRSVVDLKSLGERSILIDCDVIQADGGTRTSSITGGFIALVEAIHNLKKLGKINTFPITDYISAVSVGIQEESVYTDLDYDEDSKFEVDMNFVITGNGKFVEIQGTAEKKTFSRDHLESMTDAALAACRKLNEIQRCTLDLLGIKI